MYLVAWQEMGIRSEQVNSLAEASALAKGKLNARIFEPGEWEGHNLGFDAKGGIGLKDTQAQDSH
jgi:hypothetical protein